MKFNVVVNGFRVSVIDDAKTGLLTARAVDHPGFIVHAHSGADLANKIVPAFNSFRRAVR